MAESGPETQLAEITSSRIAAYQEGRLAITKSRRGGKLSAASVNRPLALLRTLLQLASRKWEVIAAAPVIELEKEPQGRLRWLTHEEAREFGQELIELVDRYKKGRTPASHPAGTRQISTLLAVVPIGKPPQQS